MEHLSPPSWLKLEKAKEYKKNLAMMVINGQEQHFVFSFPLLGQDRGCPQHS